MGKSAFVPQAPGVIEWSAASPHGTASFPGSEQSQHTWAATTRFGEPFGALSSPLPPASALPLPCSAAPPAAQSRERGGEASGARPAPGRQVALQRKLWVTCGRLCHVGALR